ncbi:winged helix-turn-helix domain-containing protein [Pseudomonas cichorii]|uniref:winged helix-turn-helix domain-containing protein n=1 Tax=Pseudomonas cichorii TaxID=36746 RepID=UPI001C8969C1|nr:winged helix-turn-helix domain-containing protein [Pseudomonas cichorii]MBX8532856.1 winged helix-turn-helix domain-containing protein [Pseudomonas cichorii]
METTTKGFFEELASDPAGVLGISAEIGPVIADYLESAMLSPTRDGLEQVSDELIFLFESLIKRAPKTSVDSVLGDEFTDICNRTSYILGQVSFAQLLASSALEHKVSKKFLEAMSDSVNLKYLTEMRDGEKTNVELSERVSQTVENVSRRLKRLRQLGITDFRRNGVSVLNFITPSAMSILEEAHPRAAEKKITPAAVQKIKCATSNLDSHMNAFQNFGGARR